MSIGANIGQTIDSITKHYINCTIHSFEPSPKEYKLLADKYGHLDNVFLYQLALSDKNSMIDFYQSSHSPTNSCLKPNIGAYNTIEHPITTTLQATTKTTVKGQTLDTWFDSLGSVNDIDIVKIDTQGYEYNVINGGINTLKKHVKFLYFEIQYLEFYHNTIPFYKIYELLYKNGFSLYCFLSHSKWKHNRIIESDVLFINNNIHNN